MNYKKLISKVGKWIERSEDETSNVKNSVALKKNLAIAASVALVGGYIALFTFQSREWETAKIEVPVSWPHWHTLFQSPVPFDAKLKRPSTKSILESVTTKADADHALRVHNQGAENFWIGAQIPASDLKSAAESGSNVLSLGFQSTDFYLWFDDELVLTGTKDISQMVSVPVSEKRLLSGQPLTVVFQMRNSAGWTYPDMLELFFKGPGFLSAQSAAIHAKEMDFFTSTRPSILFTLNLVMALGFLFFWISAPKRQEYFIMFLYCFVLTGLQGHLIKFAQNLVSPITGYRFDVVAFCLEGALSLSVALAFARIKGAYIKWIIGTFSVIPIITVCLYQNNFALIKLSTAIQVFLAPPLIILGALVCFAQAAYIHSGLQINLKIKKRRVMRLAIFGAGLLFIALVHILQAKEGANDSFRFWSIAHFGTVIFLAAFVGSDYHETEAMIGRVPFSAYHRPEKLNIPVTGAVVSLDLKRSETLLTEGARLGDSSVLVHEVITLMRHTLVACGGTIILTDGDAIKCFFPESARSSMTSALTALTHVENEMKTLTRAMRIQQSIPEDYEISFRAGIAIGSVRPILNVFNGKDHPEWEQVGQGQPFLESARLMEAENTLGRTADSCIVVFKACISAVDGWAEESVDAKFKHGEIIGVVALRPTLAMRSVQAIAATTAAAA